MKKFIPILLTLLCFINPAYAGSVSHVTFQDKEGTPHTIEEFQGKRVLLHFWATWCGPCVVELPSIDRLQKDLASQNVVVIPVSLDRDTKSSGEIVEFFKNHAISYLPVYRSMKHTDYASELGLMSLALPFSVIIDEQGNKVSILVGTREWDDKDLRDMLLHAKAEPVQDNRQEVTTSPEPVPTGQQPTGTQKSFSLPGLKKPSGEQFRKAHSTTE